MNLKEALGYARKVFVANNIEDSSLEAEILLRHVLNLSRAQFYLQLGRGLTTQQKQTFRELVQRRLTGEPTAYITGHREFFGYDFYVDRRVLIPRPESELLVEKAFNIADSRIIDTIADIGTGSGAIAVILAVRLPKAKVYATDISADALEVARLNAEKHGVLNRITFRHGDMLEPLPEPVDLIIANLPYVRKAEIPQTGPLSYEPRSALDGGDAGLDKITALCHQASGKLRPDGNLLLEIGQGQAEAVVSLLRRLFPSAQIEVTRDPGGIERVVSVRTVDNNQNTISKSV